MKNMIIVTNLYSGPAKGKCNKVPEGVQKMLQKILIKEAQSLCPPYGTLLVTLNCSSDYLKLSVSVQHDIMLIKELEELSSLPCNATLVSTSLYYAKALIHKYRGDIFIENEEIDNKNYISFTMIL